MLVGTLQSDVIGNNSICGQLAYVLNIYSPMLETGVSKLRVGEQSSEIRAHPAKLSGNKIILSYLRELFLHQNNGCHLFTNNG